ncbi:MAG: RidA family protein [Myxococcota bacterium]
MMNIQRVNPPQLFDGRAYGMSQGSIDPHTGLVFLSGQVAWDEQSQVRGEGYAQQAEFAVRNLVTALAAAGTDVDHVLHLRIYVRGEVSEHMAEAMPPLLAVFSDVRPAITGIGVASLATPDTLIELEATAVVPR